MPRPRRKPDIDNRISQLVTGSIEQLVGAITEEIRRNVAQEIQGYLTEGRRAGRVAVGRIGRISLRANGASRRKRIRPCIAPNCTNPSKGPRFHYLCSKHMDAPKKDYEAWRAKKLEQAA